MAGCVAFFPYSCFQEANRTVNQKALRVFYLHLSLVQLLGDLKFLLYTYADGTNESALHYSEAVEKPTALRLWLV